MRSKEDAPDYRYFPDPDLPPLVLDAGRIETERAALPELPLARRERLRSEWGIPAYDAALLTEDRALADFFENVARGCRDGKLASNWTMGEVLRIANEEGIAPASLGVSAGSLAELLLLVKRAEVSASAAKTIFARMRSTGRPAREILMSEGLGQISDEAALAAIVDEVLARHPKQAEQVRAGEDKVLGFLVGQIMKASGGKANPARARDLLARRLTGGPS
jgi:aspartyl-tRNA(Asn)/glutamyl-tRNA(Gln) amidotransferase subunit B